PVILYLHGGGYISGSLGTHQEVMGRLALASGLAVLGVDYRRAPEHPFPAALEDALVAYRGLLGEGVETRRLALAGDSAGGGLALALLATLRDFGYGLPRTAALLSPWVDLTLTAPSLEERRHLDKVLHPVILERAAELYLAGADPRDPRVSPLFGDLAGLPPMLVQVGTAELLFDDSRRLAARLREAGNSVDLRIWEEMLHFWQFYASILPEGGAAIEEAGRFLAPRGALDGSPE
ncbi:MAG: alpha/beta hydrolase, partial [Acidobacteria bacterium]|nr:alpha/beta hydrolase [Acidobacteriota bacterium]